MFAIISVCNAEKGKTKNLSAPNWKNKLHRMGIFNSDIFYKEVLELTYPADLNRLSE